MKTAGVFRAACAFGLLLWTSVGFASDLTDLLRLVNAVAQDRSNTGRAERGGRERGIAEHRPAVGQTSRDTYKHAQERNLRDSDFSDHREFGDRRSVVEDWQRQVPERSGRGTSPGRLPVAGARKSASDLSRTGRAEPGYGHAFGRNQPQASWFDEQHFGGDRFGGMNGYPGTQRPEERRSVELSLSYGNGGLRADFGVPQFVPVPQPLHHVGQIVCCRVPLATVVRVKGADHICGHAVPAVVAVRDPNHCSHDVVERVVYVQVMVPPCPPRKVEVSSCRTRVKLCFHDYEVEITSKSGVISVEYDD